MALYQRKTVRGHINVNEKKKKKIDSHKKQCVDCKARGKKMAKGYPVEMKFKCIKCGVALCQDPCFRDYHVNM